MFDQYTVEAPHMHWLKRDIWKASIALAGMLLLLILVVWVPVSAVGAHERAAGLATPVMATVQASPTIDPTIVAATAKEQVRKLERDNDRSFNAWLWNSSAALGTIGAALLAVAGVLATVLFNAQKDRKDRRDAEEKELRDRKEERRKEVEAQDKELRDRAEERFKTAVTVLGDEKESVQISGAVLLRSFLHKEDKKSYERYYTQIFDLAVAYLRLPRTSPPSEDPDRIPHSREDPNALLPLTPLRQALIVVFKEAFPLARDRLKEQAPELVFHPQSLDASRIQLDKAYLADADLEQVWMPRAFLQEADLSGADLSRANLMGTNLIGAYLNGANLGEAKLNGASLNGAELRKADLRKADLRWADLRRAKLEGALLKDTILHRAANGLAEEQLETGKANGAIIDESTLSSLQSTVFSPSPSQHNDVQAPSAPPAQVNTPPPDTGESGAPSSQQGPGA
jgi:hypothetical protein